MIAGYLLLFLVVVCISGNAAGNPVDDATNALSGSPGKTQTNLYPDLRLNKDLFKRYLENPYPVRKVVFISPRDETDPNSRSVFREGSLQADTFFCQQRNDRILQPGGTNHAYFYEGKILQPGATNIRYFYLGRISGKSSAGEYWSLNGQAIRGKGGSVNITTSDTPDPLVQTDAKIAALEGLMGLRRACWFGLAYMVPNSIVWHGDSFDFRWYDPQKPYGTNHYIVHGEVLAYTNNLPQVIRLTSANWAKTEHWTDFHYEYDFSLTNRFYPVTLWAHSLFTRNHEFQQTNYVISEIEFGEPELSVGGYELKDFLPAKPTLPPTVYIASNQYVYQYWENSVTRSKIGVPPFRPPKPRSPVPLFFVRGALIAVLFLPVVIFCIAGRNRQKQKKTTNYQTAYESNEKEPH